VAKDKHRLDIVSRGDKQNERASKSSHILRADQQRRALYEGGSVQVRMSISFLPEKTSKLP
jgi:hypothetical protein